MAADRADVEFVSAMRWSMSGLRPMVPMMTMSCCFAMAWRSGMIRGVDGDLVDVGGEIGDGVEDAGPVGGVDVDGCGCGWSCEGEGPGCRSGGDVRFFAEGEGGARMEPEQQ